MKKSLAVLMVIVGIALIIGCSQRKIAQPPEQLQPAQETVSAKETRAPAPKFEEKKPSDSVQKESLTERQMVKAAPAGTKPAVEELQAGIRDILFDYDRHDITADAKPLLKELAAVLSKDNSIKVVIEGHCDDRGTNEYNLGLGDKRANSAREYLMSLGIPSGRIETISYGEEKPACSEGTEECWAKNRRAHFVLVREAR